MADFDDDGFGDEFDDDGGDFDDGNMYDPGQDSEAIAENCYREGKKLLKSGDFAGAQEAFATILDLEDASGSFLWSFQVYCRYCILHLQSLGDGTIPPPSAAWTAVVKYANSCPGGIVDRMFTKMLNLLTHTGSPTVLRCGLVGAMAATVSLPPADRPPALPVRLLFRLSRALGEAALGAGQPTEAAAFARLALHYFEAYCVGPAAVGTPAPRSASSSSTTQMFNLPTPPPRGSVPAVPPSLQDGAAATLAVLSRVELQTKAAPALDLLVLEIRCREALGDTAAVISLVECARRRVLPHWAGDGAKTALVTAAAASYLVASRSYDAAVQHYWDAFRGFLLVGSSSTALCLGYWVVVSLLAASKVSLLGELASLRATPCTKSVVDCLSELVQAAEANSISDFDVVTSPTGSLGQSSLMTDRLFRSLVADLRVAVRERLATALLQPLSRVPLTYIAAKLECTPQEAGLIVAHLDRSRKLCDTRSATAAPFRALVDSELELVEVLPPAAN